MNPIKQQHVRNVTWSTAEAILFQAILLAHQYILFLVTDSAFYASVGMLFGLVYLMVKFLDMGLNKALFSFYYIYSRTKRACDQFLQQQLVPFFILYTIVAMATFVLYYSFPYILPHHIPCDYTVLVALLLLIFTESLKLFLKKILQLSNHFKHTAFFEVAFIIAYPALLWTIYLMTLRFSLFIIFASCALLSLLETLGLAILFFRWRSQLPLSLSVLSHSIDYRRVITMRLFAFAQTMNKQLFSANFLMPLYAYAFGLDNAALFKMASLVIHSINAVIDKILDSTSSALFSHIKLQSFEAKRSIFSLASYTSFYCILSGTIFLAVNSYCAALSITTTTMWYSILYAVVQYSDNLFIMIDRFYIAHDRADILFFTMLSTNAALLFFLWFFPNSPFYAIIFFIVCKMIAFLFLFSYISSLFLVSFFYPAPKNITIENRPS